MTLLDHTRISNKELALEAQTKLAESVSVEFPNSGAVQSVVLGFYITLADYFVRIVNQPFVVKVEEINNEIVLVFYCSHHLLSGILSPNARFDPEAKSILYILEHHPEIIGLVNILRTIRGSGFIKSGIDYAHIIDTGVYIDQAQQGTLGFAVIVSFPKNVPINELSSLF